MTECYRCWAEVDLNALRSNLAEIRALAGPKRKILTVVKADAYGHGLRQIAAVLMQSGTDIFGVANFEEARAIRSVGQGWPILMLGASLPPEMEFAVREGIMPTISSLEEARQFSALAVSSGTPLRVQVKVDTGMGRIGVQPADAADLVHAIQALPGITISGVYTHYSSAEDDAAFTAQQRQVFSQIVKTIAGSGSDIEYVHATNSGGLLLEPSERCNTVRAGLLVYGIVPPGDRLPPEHTHRRFTPALAWKSRVSFVKDVPTGTPISYGHTFVTPMRMRLATVAAGYGDGYLRAASNRAQVLISGRRCRVLGRVTMDQMIVDVTEVPQSRAGEEVVLIGRQGGEEIGATELAGWCETVPWEVLTNITYRVPRIYRGSQAA